MFVFNRLACDHPLYLKSACDVETLIVDRCWRQGPSDAVSERLAIVVGNCTGVVLMQNVVLDSDYLLDRTMWVTKVVCGTCEHMHCGHVSDVPRSRREKPIMISSGYHRLVMNVDLDHTNCNFRC